MFRFLAALTILCVPAVAQAWASEGHAIVAEIANLRINIRTRAAVARILTVGKGSRGYEIGGGSIASRDIPSWADWIKEDRPETGPWHYIDSPVSHERINPIADCPPVKSCITSRIFDFEHLLADRSRPDIERFEALRFLVHLIGDVHQPLHATDDEDRGGNKVRVRNRPVPEAEGEPELHAVWDYDLVRVYVGRTRLADYAARLNATITPADEEAWATSLDPNAWAQESHELGRTIYSELHLHPRGVDHPTLPADYAATHRDVVELQLKRAGVRLARALDAALDVSMAR